MRTIPPILMPSATATGTGFGTDGRCFSGGHGDGATDPNCDANVSNRPANSAFGVGLRGGSWDNQNEQRMRISEGKKPLNLKTAGKNISGDEMRDRLCETPCS